MEKVTYKNANESNVFFELEEDFSEVHYERIKYLDFSDWIYYISTGFFHAIYIAILGGINAFLFYLNIFSSSNLIIWIIYLWFSIYTIACFFKPTFFAYNLNRNWLGSGTIFSAMFPTKIFISVLASPFIIISYPIHYFQKSEIYLSNKSLGKFYIYRTSYWYKQMTKATKIDQNAGRVEHPHTIFIFLLNLFLGATFFGWIAAHVWAHLGHELKFKRNIETDEDEIDEDEIDEDEIDEDEIDEKFLDTIVLNEIGIHYLKLSNDQILKYEVYDDYKIKVLKTPIDLKLRRKNFKNIDDFEEFLKTVI